MAAVLMFALFAGRILAQTGTDLFPRNLGVGDSGEDVRALQKALNGILETRLAAGGPGSLGEETDYFGPLTERSVVRFQERHAGDILAPLGLSRGTGFVGPLTRRKLSAIVGSSGGLLPGPSSASSVRAPKIISISPAVVENGGEITITGEGFMPENTVRTTMGVYERVPSADGKTIKVGLYSETIELLTNPPGLPAGETFDMTQEEIAAVSQGTSTTALSAGFQANFKIPVVVFVENQNGKSGQMEIELRPTGQISTQNPLALWQKIAGRALDVVREFAPSQAYARHRFDWFQWAQGVANGMWQNYLSSGLGSAAGAAGNPAATPRFGGRITMTFTCTCPIPGVSFFIYPAGGLPGPYGLTLSEMVTALKMNYALYPGNNVLGSSYGPSTGTCGIGVLAWCFQFPVARVQVVGTSLTP